MSTRTSRFAAVAAVAAAAAIGAMLFAPQLSGAQEDTTTESTVDDTTTTEAEAPATTEAPAPAEAPATADDADPADSTPAGTEPAAPFGNHRGGRGLDVAAETIGISADDLLAALRDGQTIAEVAEANGVDPQDVTDAMVEQAKTRIEEQLAELPDRIDDIVNGTFAGPGDRFPGGPGTRGPFGGHPHGPDADHDVDPGADTGD